MQLQQPYGLVNLLFDTVSLVSVQAVCADTGADLGAEL